MKENYKKWKWAFSSGNLSSPSLQSSKHPSSPSPTYFLKLNSFSQRGHVPPMENHLHFFKRCNLKIFLQKNKNNLTIHIRESLKFHSNSIEFTVKIYQLLNLKIYMKNLTFKYFAVINLDGANDVKLIFQKVKCENFI